jgi:hypothetical protein
LKELKIYFKKSKRVFKLPFRDIRLLFTILSQVTKQLPFLTNEWIRRTTSVSTLTFIMGGLLHSHQKAYQFRKENQLTVYVDKSMANVRIYLR